MRLIELFEAKPAKKIVVKSAPVRNFVAKNAKTSGAGPHTKKGYDRNQEKRKPIDE